MIKRLIIGTLFVFGCILAALGGLYTGYLLELNSDDSIDYTRPELTVQAVTTGKVTDSTVFEFVYRYADGFTESQQSLPEQYMIGWDREHIAQAYSDWTMTEFSPSLIVFTRQMAGNSSQHYIVKELRGYLAVYYSGSEVLKELTAVPVAALSEADRELYRQGVRIDGEERLEAFLENMET
jgi:hypothetical protein